jgi:hypothetical protein
MELETLLKREGSVDPYSMRIKCDRTILPYPE